MTASTTPPLLHHLAHVGRAPVLVTGATGVLGGYVLDELSRADTPARALCHRHVVADDVDAVPGDLRTGRGLRFALDGVKAVIHLASDKSVAFETTAMTNLLQAIDRYAPQTHLIYVSAVECWDSARTEARAKCDAENLLTQWSGRFSIIRSAPSFERVYRAVHGLGLYGGPPNIRIAPLDLGFLARTCVDTAARHTTLGSPLNVYGPETHSLHDFAQLCAQLEGARGVMKVLKTPVTASTLRGDVWQSDPEDGERRRRQDALTTPDATTRGGINFAQWWTDHHGAQG